MGYIDGGDWLKLPDVPRGSKCVMSVSIHKADRQEFFTIFAYAALAFSPGCRLASLCVGV
jgi:hypothetical protein